MRRLRVLLMQLPVPNNPATNLPLAAGYLKAYARSRGLLALADIDILPRELADSGGDALLLDAIAARAPDVLGISLYTWNSERSLALALRLKQRLPGLLVVVGGPEVQRDNAWVLRHPAVDLAVIGEGEQTFAEALRALAESWPRRDLQRLAGIPGVALRDDTGALLFAPEREGLADLSVVPSPYLEGDLEVRPGDMLMVEVSRWCPYACSFCLYGRNMGPKLGSRYFGLERLLAEIRHGRERGAASVHFIEANLNLVPVFRPLTAALADLNADGALALYAELRGEHLTEEAVAALAGAGLKVAEVGLQTANPVALKAALRRTDLRKWAAGTRRLYAHGVEVLLDVILGLPEDDEAGVAETLEFIRRESLGPYDVFTLQLLPGTAVRRQAAEYGIVYQDRPPYYVLGTNRLSYAALRRLRRELKLGAGLDPRAVDGCPEPRPDALARPEAADSADEARQCRPITRLDLRERPAGSGPLADAPARRLATHVDVLAPAESLAALAGALAPLIDANPATLLDLYLFGAPPPAELRSWRAALPWQPGYLDRVAVYRREAPEPAHARVSPRLFLVVPWTAQIDPRDYEDVAEVIWVYDAAPGEEPPLGAWRAAGGAGVWARGAGAAEAARWSAEAGVRLWHGDEEACG